MHRIHRLVAAAALLAGCASGGVRVGPLRVIPPAPGESIGRAEVTVFNGSPVNIEVGSLEVLQDGESVDGIGNGPLLGTGGPPFATFGASDVCGPSLVLAPGDSCVLTRPMVVADPHAEATVSVQGQVILSSDTGDRTAWTSAPRDIRPGEWPRPEPMTEEALDRALAAGRGLTVVLQENSMPTGGIVVLAVEPDGRACGWGWGGLPGKTSESRSIPFRASGTLTPGDQEALHAAVRVAPFAAYVAHPEMWAGMDDGHPVRLLVTAGPAAFAASSQEKDFRDAGLRPLLEHLRGVLRGLPEIDSR